MKQDTAHSECVTAGWLFAIKAHRFHVLYIYYKIQPDVGKYPSPMNPVGILDHGTFSPIWTTHVRLLAVALLEDWMSSNLAGLDFCCSG